MFLQRRLGGDIVAVQTFLAQQEGVECHVIGAEVQYALAWDPALPAAAGELRHQHLLWREAEVQLKLLERLPEALRVLLLGRLSTPRLLRYQTLQRRTGERRGRGISRRKPTASVTTR
jgi:hypothetical protein